MKPNKPGRYGGLIVMFLLLLACRQAEPVAPLNIYVDTLIKGATILDGTGGEAFVGDVGISGERIVFVGQANDRVKAGKTIDANGYTLTPGFIDPHTHTLGDLGNDSGRYQENYLRQGVTTVICGNDGGSTMLIGKRLALWDSLGIGTNAALLVGHGTIRRHVMGLDIRPPDSTELEKMKGWVQRGMEEGAIGLSCGLYYVPGAYSETDEVIELAKVAASLGGYYDVHMRDESSYNIGLIGAINESIQIGKEAGIHVHIAHIKALGVDVWGFSDSVVQLIDTARAQGVSISADQYPYRASGTHLMAALVPKEVQWINADRSTYLKNRRDTAIWPKVEAEMRNNLRRRGGAVSLLFRQYSRRPELVGKTLAQVSDLWDMDPIETAIKVIREGGGSVASFNMREPDIAHFMKQDWVMTGSDGSYGHPRKYGSYPKKIKEYVLDKKVISLSEMVRKSSLLVAESTGIPERGKVERGYYADLILFQPAEIKDEATFAEPFRLAKGMWYVWVNGQAVIEKSEMQPILAGKTIRKK